MHHASVRSRELARISKPCDGTPDLKSDAGGGFKWLVFKSTTATAQSEREGTGSSAPAQPEIIVAFSPARAHPLFHRHHSPPHHHDIHPRVTTITSSLPSSTIIMIGQNVARASRSSLRAASLLGRRTMVTQEERWTLENARNAGSFIEGPNKVQLSHVVPNIEASWKSLSKEEQYGVFRQLEELQRKDWKELSVDEKKAAASIVPHQGRQSLDIGLNPAMRTAWSSASPSSTPPLASWLRHQSRRDPCDTSPYFVSFGPHGPRKPITASGQGAKTFAGVVAALGVTTGVFYLMRANGGAPVKTMTKEWQEASNEIALEQKQNPITGIASDNYKGKGHVQSA
ncbi:cytochrome c oxidase subunit V [Moesziomyces antarcticus]|uniref:Cytochrome c oxidase subunit V n=1 Tax=Pseudozyma antarctica TaxID=84753 RepID=A0A081CKE4_PSEA2|nr:cytochrome c oxidase subunit V [Moesziomyces antarcticus]GAK67140.1 cytochrome c oxidase subunit V [Moesziomyces antarcticus]